MTRRCRSVSLFSTSLGHGFRDQTDDVAAAHLDGDAEGDEVLLRALARLGHRSDADHPHVMTMLSFARFVVQFPDQWSCCAS